MIGAASTPSERDRRDAPSSLGDTSGFLTNGGVAGYQTLESFVARQTAFVVQNADYRSPMRSRARFGARSPTPGSSKR